MRNGEDLCVKEWQPDDPAVEFLDSEALEDVAVKDSLFHPDPFVVYYVRVESHFHQTQWSSPIWLDL